MPYSYHLSKAAESYLRRLPPQLRLRIVSRIRSVCDDPFDTNHSKPLKGPLRTRRSARAGVYRIIFEVLPEELQVLIVDIGPRGDVYKD